MPRTALTISALTTDFQGISGGSLATDTTTDTELSINMNSTAPRVGVIAVNTGAVSRTFTVILPATRSTYSTAVSKTVTVPAAVAGVPGVNFVVFDDISALNSASGLVYLDSGSLAGVYCLAVSWSPSVGT